LAANSAIKEANGEAEAIRLTGEAKASAYKAGVTALGSQAYTILQLMQVIGDRRVRVVPDVSVSSNNGGGGLLDGLMAMLLKNQLQQPTSIDSNSSEPEKVMETKSMEKSDRI
jgi:uncharacterized membrane protein YqiK